MGVLFDYFAAGSDDEAGAVVDRIGGPGTRDTLVAAPAQKKRGLFSRKTASPEPSIATDPSLPLYDTVSLKGIDPIVRMGTLESLLTGRPYDDVVADPRSGNVLAARDDGERVVCTLTDALATALADASPEAIMQVAEPWSETEEFWGEADPKELAEIIGDLAALGRRARDNGQRLYCWICV